MKTVHVQENQKGLLFKNGRFQKLLGPGKYRLMGSCQAEILPLDKALVSGICPLDILLADQTTAAQICTVEVADRQFALHFVDGNFSGVLLKGRHAFWKAAGDHTFRLVDLTSPFVEEDFPVYLFRELPSYLYQRVEVAPYQKARLYLDKKLNRLLEPGVYYFWKTPVQVEVDLVDTRLLQMDLTGQEIMTQDKVFLRINFVFTYRITDYVRIAAEIDDYAEQLHIAAQLALRDYVARYRLDELLAGKEEMSRLVLEKLKSRGKDFFVEITDGGVKDIVLPGNIREIMNTVLLAEKRAQANVITRREEVASTRSLLNTARLMEENQTLCKLKELEYLERICENVGSINLNGSGGVLSQLSALLGKGRPEA